MSTQKANDTGVSANTEHTDRLETTAKRAQKHERWRSRMAWLGNYYSSNLLFVRLVAILLIGLVAALMVLHMRHTPRPTQLRDIPERFARHIRGEERTQRERKKKESGGARARGKSGAMGRRMRRSRRRRRMFVITQPVEKEVLERLKKKGMLGLLAGGGGRAGGIVSAKGFGKDDADALARWQGSRRTANKKRKKRVQVWQRTRRNTILSKVSVGDGKYLILKKMRVTVHIEGLRARTVIDHIYYNPHGRTLQGTFKYTLPPDASVSYYAMFVGRRRRRLRFFSGKSPRGLLLAQMRPRRQAQLSPQRDWGTLREARLVPAEKGREVYEDITRRRIDPALLEQDAPNTFTGRVFPIQAKGYNRIIIAYEQTLPQLQQEHLYRFRFPNDVAQAIDFSLSYNAKLSTLSSHNLRRLRCKQPGKNGFLRCYWEENKPDRDAVFAFRPQRQDVSWVAGSDPVDQRRYLYARVRVPMFPGTRRYSASHGIFVLDTSLSANPDLFAAHVALLQQILRRNQSQLRRFNVLLYDVGATWMSRDGWLHNTARERRRILRKIRRIVLEGATDGAVAMQALTRPPWKPKQNTDVDVFFLSDGQWNWGNTSVAEVNMRFRQHHPWGRVRLFAYRMGIGSENLSLLRELTRQGGAVYNCLGRAELPRCARAHTRPAMLLEQVKVEGIQASEILVGGRQTHLYPGAFVTIASRFVTDGKVRLVLKGHYAGKPKELVYTFPVQAHGDLAPRAWAELVIDQLTALEHPSLTKLIVAYAQHFHVPNQHCSFLVLETDGEYKQYGLEEQKRAQQVKDVERFMTAWRRRHARPVSQKQRWLALLRRSLKRSGQLRTSTGRTVLALLHRLPDEHFELPAVTTKRLWLRDQVPGGYLKRRMNPKYRLAPFSQEAKRRLKESTSGAIRCLSSIVEKNPGSPQSLRLVGYYLMSWKRPAQAARIFLRVLERRTFEPHSFRDLARALLKIRRPGLASALYEVILAGRWDSRFGRVKVIAREEYALLAQQAPDLTQNTDVLAYLSQRRAMLGLHVQRSRLRVTVTWNTDSSDIDLWVHEPNGEKCSYDKPRTANGALLEDITGGYGPERYESRRGAQGVYQIRLHYFANNGNTLGNETHASVLIVLHAGTPRQRVIEKNIVLKRYKQFVTVAALRI